MSPALPFYVREDDPPAKREILRAALRLFSTRGVDATSIRDIAAESGFTNPALYKHFTGKDDLALQLFDACHTRVWETCAAALATRTGVADKLQAYIGRWLELMDEHPQVLAFLQDHARTLWPRAGASVRRRTMIDLARRLAREARTAQRGATRLDVDVAAAALQGTLAELGRMITVGVVAGPAIRWKPALVAQFTRLFV